MRSLAAGPRGRHIARRQLSVLALRGGLAHTARPLIDEQVVLGVE